jgi:hypothetical protein
VEGQGIGFDSRRRRGILSNSCDGSHYTCIPVHVSAAVHSSEENVKLWMQPHFLSTPHKSRRTLQNFEIKLNYI